MLDWRRAHGQMTLLDMFMDGVAAHPDRTFSIYLDQKLSWAEAANAVRAVAADLAAARGRDIALIIPNSPAYLIVTLGAIHAGARPAMINPGLPETLTRRILYQLAPSRILTGGQTDLGLGEVTVTPDPTFGGAPEIAEPDAVSAYFFTGGTTGVPKRIAYSHEMMVAAAERMTWCWPMAEAEVHLSIAPYTHIYGFNMGVGAAIKSGATSVIADKFTPDYALDLMETYKVTVLGGGPPAVYQALLSSPTLPDRDLSALRVCPGGGAPFPLETHARWKAATGLNLYEAYGMTEIAPITGNTDIAGRREGSAGKPPPDTEVGVVDLETDAPVPTGATGEIRTRGPHMMTGYVANEEETAIALKDGWVMTGDIGRLDEDGFLFITDRKKDVVFCKGFNVFPREVEEVLNAVPGVQMACVVGVPHDRTGERVVAFVSGAPDETALHTACAENLADYKVPSAIHIRDTMPLTPAGKIDRIALRAEASG